MYDKFPSLVKKMMISDFIFINLFKTQLPMINMEKAYMRI